jgi:hypothetical protein
LPQQAREGLCVFSRRAENDDAVAFSGHFIHLEKG